MDFNKIKEAAQSYQADMTAFLRAIVRNPGESCDEKAHIDTIAAEMKKLDFDEVVIDPQGNVIGYMGTGDRIIAYDAHIDTVGIGNIDNWTFDPYEGYENETEIGGRGVSDQCGGLGVMLVFLIFQRYTILIPRAGRPGFSTYRSPVLVVAGGGPFCQAALFFLQVSPPRKKG